MGLICVQYFTNQFFLIYLVQFWLCCCITLTFLQILAALFMLPPVLTPSQTLWIICVTIPVLSVSLMGSRPNVEIMKKPQGKNHFTFNSEVIIVIFFSFPRILVKIIHFYFRLLCSCSGVME